MPHAPDSRGKAPDGFDKALEVMARLRAPDGCPWDREQDHKSLKPYLIEEAYEVLEAIDAGDAARLREELGDLLLQVIFHCQLARERGLFDAFEVAQGLAEKMIERHPHVFGEGQARTSAEVLRNWEIQKRNGRARDGEKEGSPSILDGVPAALPALLRAQRLQGKAARVGFDWKDAAALERELGDFLFAAVNLARKLRVDAEQAAQAAVGRFTARFHFIEAQLRARGLSPEQVPLEELDRLWEEAKAREAGPSPA